MADVEQVAAAVKEIDRALSSAIAAEGNEESFLKEMAALAARLTDARKLCTQGSTRQDILAENNIVSTLKTHPRNQARIWQHLAPASLSSAIDATVTLRNRLVLNETASADAIKAFNSTCEATALTLYNCIRASNERRQDVTSTHRPLLVSLTDALSCSEDPDSAPAFQYIAMTVKSLVDSGECDAVMSFAPPDLMDSAASVAVLELYDAALESLIAQADQSQEGEDEDDDADTPSLHKYMSTAIAEQLIGQLIFLWEDTKHVLLNYYGRYDAAKDGADGVKGEDRTRLRLFFLVLSIFGHITASGVTRLLDGLADLGLLDRTVGILSAAHSADAEHIRGAVKGDASGSDVGGGHGATGPREDGDVEVVSGGAGRMKVGVTYEGLKRDCVRIIANLTYRSPHNQEKLQQLSAVDLLLNQCALDPHNAHMREWALLALRNVTEHNEAIREHIRSLQLQGTDTNPDLARRGLDVRVDATGRIHVDKM